jgi:autoinducer 2-degrading protein
MIVTCVHVHVKPEFTEAFTEATTANHLESVKEPGNIRFDFVQQADDPCRFLIYEAYRSEEAAAAHKNTPHYLKWRDTVADWMTEPRKGVKYHFIAPLEATV